MEKREVNEILNRQHRQLCVMEKRMKKTKAIEKLNRQISVIEELRNKTYKLPEFKKWQRDTKIALERIFGKDARHVHEFSNINFFVTVYR